MARDPGIAASGPAAAPEALRLRELIRFNEWPAPAAVPVVLAMWWVWRTPPLRIIAVSVLLALPFVSPRRVLRLIGVASAILLVGGYFHANPWTHAFPPDTSPLAFGLIIASGSGVGALLCMFSVWQSNSRLVETVERLRRSEFRQVGTDHDRRTEGTGLGLALVQRLVELHGSRIDLESELGRGSCFTVTLPMRVPMDLRGKEGA